MYVCEYERNTFRGNDDDAESFVVCTDQKRETTLQSTSPCRFLLATTKERESIHARERVFVNEDCSSRRPILRFPAVLSPIEIRTKNAKERKSKRKRYSSLLLLSRRAFVDACCAFSSSSFRRVLVNYVCVVSLVSARSSTYSLGQFSRSLSLAFITGRATTTTTTTKLKKQRKKKGRA